MTFKEIGGRLVPLLFFVKFLVPLMEKGGLIMELLEFLLFLIITICMVIIEIKRMIED